MAWFEKKCFWAVRTSLWLTLSACIFAACERTPTAQFTKLSKGDTGVDFRNRLEPSDDLNVLQYIYFYNGAGVAVGDLNNDGLPDLFFAGNMVKNRLYINKGDFHFEDITKTAHIAEKEGWCVGATMADVNGDGWLDVYVCRSADGREDMRRNLLFLNDGADASGTWRGTFSERGAAYGLDDPGYSTQAAFFDADRDGDLDMLLINHSLSKYTGVESQMVQLKQQKNPAFSSKFYLNDEGKFHNRTDSVGITNNVLSFGLGVGVSDANGDGWLDVYVCNDFNEQDYLFINKGAGPDGKTWAGGFQEALPKYMDHCSLFSMGCDWADLNNDARPDLLTLDMLPEDNFTQKIHMGAENYTKFQLLFEGGFYYQFSRNMLQLNNGDGTFSEIGQLAGISNTDWSWAVLGADFDNDGWKDVFVTNGYVKDYTDMDFLKYTTDQMQVQNGQKPKASELLKTMRGSQLVKYMFHNRGDLTFENTTKDWGLADEGFAYGAAYADLDNDGDLDLVTNNIDDYAGIYRNNGNALSANNWLKISLQAPNLPKNTRAIGAKVSVFAQGRTHYQELVPTRGYASSVDYTLVFGLGSASQADSIHIAWPDGSVQRLGPTPTKQVLTIQQQASLPSKPLVAAPTFFSTDTAAFSGFRHREVPPFRDFQMQNLLPAALSCQGPCMAAADVDGDGLKDVYIGGAKDQTGALYKSVAGGNFRLIPTPAFMAHQSSEDTGATFLDADGDGDQDLYVVSGGYEYTPEHPLLQDRLYLNNGRGQFSAAPAGSLPTETSAGSCARAADVDGDGDQDLFVGGRVLPGRFPEAAASLLLRNDGKGHFTNEINTLAPELAKGGMVTDAQWTNLDADPLPELVVVGQWMPIRFFDNHEGQLRENNAHLTVPSAGWWNCLTPADCDGDGDIDFLAGNLGRNTQIKASATQPATLLYTDLDGNGSVDPILSWYMEGKSYPAAFRDDLADQIPSIKKRFNDFKTYAQATTDDLFSPEQLKKATTLKTVLLESVLLENQGNGQFALKILPTEAQFSPIHTAQWLDVDGDGHLDVVLAGNERPVRIRFGRYDANHGTLLRGDGKGNFSYVPQYQSGLRLRADVRSSIAVGNTLVFGVNNGTAVRARRL